MKKYLFLLAFLSFSFLYGESGLYLGGQASLDYRKVDFKDLSASSIYDKYSSKANYGFIAGYSLPTPVLYLAAEYGMDLKSSDVSFYDYSGSTPIGREFSSSEMKYIDILPGLSFFLDRVLVNGIVGMERSKLKLSENIVVASYESSTNRKAKRLGGAISFYPISSLGFRLSVVQSSYQKTTYVLGTDTSSIEPKIVRATLALIWQL